MRHRVAHDVHELIEFVFEQLSCDNVLWVWYRSDGKKLLFATYVGAWNEWHIEAEISEFMVRSRRFHEQAGLA